MTQDSASSEHRMHAGEREHEDQGETQEEMVPWVDEERCTACGLCVRECTRHLSMKHGSHVDPRRPKCIRCFHCVAVCPREAIRVDGCTDEDPALSGLPPQMPAVDAGAKHTVSEADLRAFLARRRSHRRFLPKEVDKDTVARILDAAKFVPSGGNRHAYEFTVITSEGTKAELRGELARIYRKRLRIMGNPILRAAVWPFLDQPSRAFLGDRVYFERFVDLLERFLNGEDPVFCNAPVVVIIHSRVLIPTPKEDCVLAGYHIGLVSQALGLGSCFVSLAQNAINSGLRCKRIARLSGQDRVHAVVVIGYPAQVYRRSVPRASKPIRWC